MVALDATKQKLESVVSVRNNTDCSTRVVVVVVAVAGAVVWGSIPKQSALLRLIKKQRGTFSPVSRLER